MSTQALREVAAEFGIEWEDKKLKKGMQTITGAIGLFGQFAQAVASSPIVGALRSLASQFEEQAGHIEDTANSLGVTTDALQELNYAADQGGVGADQMTAALAALQRNAVAAAAGGGGAVSAFRALGVTLRDAHGQTRPTVDLMTDLAAGLGRIEDPARRTALAQQTLGRSGRQLLTILHDGEGGLAAWRREFAQLGGGIGADAIATAGAYGDALNRWKVASDGLRAQIANAFLPVLTAVTTWVTRAVASVVTLTRGTDVWRIAFALLGSVAAAAGFRIARAWVPVLWQFRALAAGFAFLVLAGDDFMTLMRGGDSVIGRFIDRMAGVGASARFVRVLREAWNSLPAAASAASTYLGEAWAGMQLAAGNAAFAIGEFFDGLWRGMGAGLQRALTWMSERLTGWIRPVAGFFARVGGAIGNAWRQTGDDWGAILHGTPLSTAAPATPRGVAPPNAVTVPAGRPPVAATSAPVVHAPATITIQDSRNPEATAAAVARRLDRHHAAAADAAHPRPARED